MLIYSDDIIEEVKNASDIVDIISQYITLKRSGRNFFGLCPFHKEKSPSFSVSPDKQIFHCFGCGTGGNVIHFVNKIENMNFKETIEMLAEKSGILLPQDTTNVDSAKSILKNKIYEINKIAAEFYHENLYKESAKHAQEYVKRRKLDNNTLKSFLIGCSGSFNELYNNLKSKGFSEKEILESGLVNKNDKGQYIDRFRKRLMFPILDIREKVIGFGGRVLDDSMPNAPKYINSAENLVYSKGKNLYGLNVAKKHDLGQIIIVEGYMDAISLHQRGITNVVASLGTALTENQGRLLRKYTEKIIIGYDSDGAGQAAALRGLEILQDLGCDIRILQLEDAKDPDEFVIKHGTVRFNQSIEKAISLVEFKVKMLKKGLSLESTNDKIKFLNGIAKILSNTPNNIEQEIYIDKISEEYKISKESLYAQINKLKYNANDGKKILESTKVVGKPKENLSQVTINREKMLVYLLINNTEEVYKKVKDEIRIENFNKTETVKIVQKLYEEFEKGNSNIYKILDLIEEQDVINYITEIMSTDFDISDVDKCLQDIINNFKKDNLNMQKKEIFKKLEQKVSSKEETEKLERQLNDIILELAKLK